MEKKTFRKDRDSGVPVVVFWAVLIVALAGVLIYWNFFRTKPAPAPEPVPEVAETPSPTPVPTPAPTPPAIDYNKIDKSEDYRDLMQKRKEKYGVENSVDLIVKEDETIKIGENTIPMREILEKIKLRKKGDILVRDLDATGPDRDETFQKLDRAEERHAELERLLNSPDAMKDPGKYRELMAEYTELRNVAEEYRDYKNTVGEIEEHEAILKDGAGQKFDDEIRGLETEKGDLEKHLDKTMQTGGDKKQLFEKLRESEKRLRELETALAGPDAATDPEAYQRDVKERTELAKIVADYQAYKKIEKRLNLISAVPASSEKNVRNRLDDLLQKKAYLENELLSRYAKKPADVYGVYVVKSGDNVWNIHFAFFKDYYDKRGIAVLPLADEPLNSGTSSGVAKILKFSEKMVYIYNVREGSLSVDLNMIHPLSKIVIFNLGQAFSILGQVDYTNINEIRFDGDTLWLPGES